MAASPYEMLDDDSKRYFRRRANGIVAVMLAGLSAEVGLLVYMLLAKNVNWGIVVVWFSVAALGTRLGVRAINKQLERFTVEKLGSPPDDWKAPWAL